MSLTLGLELGRVVAAEAVAVPGVRLASAGKAEARASTTARATNALIAAMLSVFQELARVVVSGVVAVCARDTGRLSRGTHTG